MLDYLVVRHKVKCHSIVGRFNAQWFAQSKKYCRTGSIANTIRVAIRHLVSCRIPISRWIYKSTWSHAMPNKNYISDVLCKDACVAAAAQRHIDWSTECQMFGVSTSNEVPEDWDVLAWDNPLAHDLDRRALYLDPPCPVSDAGCGDFPWSAHTRRARCADQASA